MLCGADPSEGQAPAIRLDDSSEGRDIVPGTEVHQLGFRVEAVADMVLLPRHRLVGALAEGGIAGALDPSGLVAAVAAVDDRDDPECRRRHRATFSCSSTGAASANSRLGWVQGFEGSRVALSQSRRTKILIQN